MKKSINLNLKKEKWNQFLFLSPSVIVDEVRIGFTGEVEKENGEIEIDKETKEDKEGKIVMIVT